MKKTPKVCYTTLVTRLEAMDSEITKLKEQIKQLKSCFVTEEEVCQDEIDAFRVVNCLLPPRKCRPNVNLLWMLAPTGMRHMLLRRMLLRHSSAVRPTMCFVAELACGNPPGPCAQRRVDGLRAFLFREY